MVNPETGEVNENLAEEMEKLQMDRETKIKNVICFAKDLAMMNTNIDTEMDRLAEVKDRNKKKIESLKQYLAFALNGQKYRFEKGEVSYRNSKSVNITDEEQLIEWAKNNAPEIVKTETKESILKAEIKNLNSKGIVVPFATIEEKTTINIK